MAKKSAPSAETDTQPRLAAFEDSVTELEGLVEALESGDVSLEQALAKFERGVILARECQQTLKHAELRVDQLLADGDGEHIATFDTPSDTQADDQR
ncbi:Exodeoxyribonuclease 7 small subunit protein [Salinisphaera shabanensis E1L3A]|mgnify:CR=1 FL=1|jgi:exodeoxyribonuclease VII small subunit|uniref:Exodeoxyribonuclease 7 small subunit n=1 Tax=Salinisphaera shabanensis E1L3A TaxID=1033802 RepID=U2FS67_9GAMM|nr:exodeoxyribonuclease VII small subunit [Salinisphaera shabanensis]ERJ18889.1 Exodeoxyribonuclease 7 small subunit protein [Salinisphaera shabanensis E1L3A]